MRLFNRRLRTFRVLVDTNEAHTKVYSVQAPDEHAAEQFFLGDDSVVPKDTPEPLLVTDECQQITSSVVQEVEKE